jgi:hypothetical protein
MDKKKVNIPVPKKNTPPVLVGLWYPSARPLKLYRATLTPGCTAYGLQEKFCEKKCCLPYKGGVASFSGRPLIRPAQTIVHPSQSTEKYYTTIGQYLRGRGSSYASKQVGAPVPNTPYIVNCDVVTAPSAYQGSGGNDLPCCTTTVYKPSNAKFSTQGGVSSSERMARLKKDLTHYLARPEKAGVKKQVPYSIFAT